MRQKIFSILLVLLLFSFHEVKASVHVKLNELTSFFNDDWGKTNGGEDPSLPFSVSAYFSPCFKFDANFPVRKGRCIQSVDKKSDKGKRRSNKKKHDKEKDYMLLCWNCVFSLFKEYALKTTFTKRGRFLLSFDMGLLSFFLNGLLTKVDNNFKFFAVADTYGKKEGNNKIFSWSSKLKETQKGFLSTCGYEDHQNYSHVDMFSTSFCLFMSFFVFSFEYKICSYLFYECNFNIGNFFCFLYCFFMYFSIRKQYNTLAYKRNNMVLASECKNNRRMLTSARSKEQMMSAICKDMGGVKKKVDHFYKGMTCTLYLLLVEGLLSFSVKFFED